MDQQKTMTWTWPVALCASAEAVNSSGSLWKDDVVWDGLEKHEGEALCNHLLLLKNSENLEFFPGRALLHCLPFPYWDRSSSGFWKGRSQKECRLLQRLGPLSSWPLLCFELTTSALTVAHHDPLRSQDAGTRLSLKCQVTKEHLPHNCSQTSWVSCELLQRVLLSSPTADLIAMKCRPRTDCLWAAHWVTQGDSGISLLSLLCPSSKHFWTGKWAG